MLNTGDDLKIVFAAIGFRRLLSFEKNPPIQTFVDANLVPRFIQYLLREDLPKLQFEAAWCLTNVASGSYEHVQVLIGKGTIESFVKLLDSPHLEVKEQAIWGLGNMAGEGPRIRDLVINAGAVKPISDMLDRTTPGSTFTRNASWTLSNLCRGRPAPDYKKVFRCVSSLAKVLIENDSEEIIGDICWAFSYISDGGAAQIPVILQTNVLPRIVQLLEHQTMAICVSCLRTIGNVLTGNDMETQIAIEAGALQALNRLITHQKKAVRKEVCWSVSNITAGNDKQVQLAIDTGLIDKLIHILQHDDNEIRKEAVWALSNTTQNATPQQYMLLVERQALKALTCCLDFVESRVLIVAMEGIENILKMGAKNFINDTGDNMFAIQFELCGGVDKLEELQMHKNHQIYEKAVSLLESYYSTEAEGTDNLMDVITQSQSSGQTFQF